LSSLVADGVQLLACLTTQRGAILGHGVDPSIGDSVEISDQPEWQLTDRRHATGAAKRRGCRKQRAYAKNLLDSISPVKKSESDALRRDCIILFS
jgi:hypothetical protein